MEPSDCLVVASAGRNGIRIVRTEGCVSGRTTLRYGTAIHFGNGSDLHEAWVLHYDAARPPMGRYAVMFRVWTNTLATPTTRVVSVQTVEDALELIAHTEPYDFDEVELYTPEGDLCLTFSAHDHHVVST